MLTDRLTVELGRALRRARVERGLTLRGVEDASRGAFKATSVAGYERGERKITVERFFRLARFYGRDPGALLSRAIEAAQRRSPEVVVDLSRLMVVLPDLEEPERRVIEGYVAELRAEAGASARAIRFDPDHLERLAREAGRAPEELLDRLRPALAPADRPPPR